MDDPFQFSLGHIRVLFPQAPFNIIVTFIPYVSHHRNKMSQLSD
jgi:hypothetical protein